MLLINWSRPLWGISLLRLTNYAIPHDERLNVLTSLDGVKFGAQERAKPRMDIIRARLWEIGRILLKPKNTKNAFKMRTSFSSGIETSLLNFSAVALFRYINNSLFTRGVFDQVKSREIVFENSTDENFA